MDRDQMKTSMADEAGEFITGKEAITDAILTAVNQMPEGATFVGFAVFCAFRPPATEDVLEATGAYISVQNVPPRAIADLFLKYAEMRAESAPGPRLVQPPRPGTLLHRGPARRRRR